MEWWEGMRPPVLEGLGGWWSGPGEVKSRLSPTWPESAGEHNYGCVGTVDSALWSGPVPFTISVRRTVGGGGIS